MGISSGPDTSGIDKRNEELRKKTEEQEAKNKRDSERAFSRSKNKKRGRTSLIHTSEQGVINKTGVEGQGFPETLA